MNIGTRKIVVDEAIAQLRLYAETNGAVLQYYDGLPGMTTVGGSDPNRVTLEEYSVSNRGLRSGLCGTPWQVQDQVVAFEKAGIDLLLLQCSPQLEEMERFAETVIAPLRTRTA